MRIKRIYIVQSPLSFMISMMDIEYNRHNPNDIIFISKDKFSFPSNIRNSFKCIVYQPSIFNRILKKIFSIYLPPLNLYIKLLNLYLIQENIYIYCSWMFEEAEYISNWVNCKKHFYLEDGQFGQLSKSLYENKNNLLFKHRKNLNRYEYSFRKDCSGFLCINENAYKAHHEVPRFIYKDFKSCFKWYTPKLKGVNTIILGPHPNRMNKKTYVKSILDKCMSIETKWALKLHWGIICYKKLYKQFLEAFKNIDPNIGILCDQYTIIELEMFLEKKNLLGQVTSLAIYAEQFGSTYKLINFDGYKGFKDNSEFFMPESINK